MTNKSQMNMLHNMTKSKFVRSVFLRILIVFLIVVLAIIAIVFFSFTSEINDNIVSDRQKQLERIRDTISDRMDEISSIAYNVGNDSTFYIGDVSESSTSGLEMAKNLKRYLVGNDFIEHLAFYRLSEPDKIYVSSGELKFSDFWSTYLNIDGALADEYTEKIQSTTSISIASVPFTNDGSKSFLAYIYPLPAFSDNPRAYVLMLIPHSEVKPVMESQLNNCYGQVAIFDEKGQELTRSSNLENDIPIDLNDENGKEFSYDGKKYIFQKTVAKSNGWTYVSIIRLNDIISEMANKQIIFIILLFILMLIAVLVLLAFIAKQYRPISDLAMTLSEGDNAIIDEQSLISGKIAVLKGDSEQKQKFEAAYHAADAANKAKSTFLSNMSHDIRTPMNAIVGMTEIALKNVYDPKYVKECLDNVSVASQYLLDIINNVLDMSRIESGNFSLSKDTVELPKLLHGIITILNHNLEVKSQKLTIEIDNIEDEKVICDGVRLSQVFMNILSNSVKFTPNGGTIGFYMTQTNSENGYGDYVFVFTDNGIGMSPEFTKMVFDTFTRDEKSSTSKIEGTGLGMAIAKSFIDLMGGTISCKSEPNKGTQFTVNLRLPLAENSSDNDTSFDGTSVLIIGGEEKTCQSQAKMFSEYGVEAAYASSTVDALSKAEKALKDGKAYDYIIINQTSDDTSGLKTKAQLTAKTSHKTTFILAARDIFAVKQSSAYDNGISAVIQAPLFKSSVLGILNRNFEPSKNTSKNDIINLEGKRILLVEDNLINRKIAMAMMSETKAGVYVAENGKEAVDAFKEHDVGFFDLILMDVQMPVMNGYEATVAIRSIQREDSQTIPIYAMTANTFDEDVRQVKESGMNGHLGKPYSSKDLYKILENAIEL